MGNKLSCNCGPLTRKPYRYEDTPWSAGSSSRSFSKRDGHLLRLWAEVFHVTTAGGGSVKWQQVSEDLVPVNITCVQDSPEVAFNITAYNSQVDKILDVRLVQPGTKIGQASECFVYWKDPVTSDTWGLNFTSPIDAKQFRECCSPAFKFSRKASSSYSLKLENNARGRGGTVSGTASRGGSGRINATSASAARRRPLSTPTSPSKSREPQCTCMTAEQYARLRAMDPRFRAASTLPRSLPNQAPREGGGREKVPGDNYATIRRPEAKGAGSGPEMDGDDRPDRSRGRTSGRGGREILVSKSVDYSDNELASRDTIERKKSRSKSTDDVTERNGQQAGGQSSSRRGVLTQQQQTEVHGGHHHGVYARSRTLPSKSTIGTNTTPTGDGLTDSQTLKRLLKPIPSGSVVTSPEMSRRVYHHDGYDTEPEIRHVSTHTTQGKRPTDTLRRIHERSRGVGTQTGYGKLKSEASPPSDHPLFDHAYYATTPPSSSPEAHASPSPGSPTARLLLEYEQHLRNTLAKGMDAESYSLTTFEAIISQSNENLAVPPNSRSTTLPRFGIPTRENFRCSREVSKESRDSDVLSGYYSDFRDRGYLSDHNSRSSGYFDRPEGVKSGYFSDRERSGYFSDREVHAHHKYGSMRQQASVESADSRLCYLTSSEISDDERMSLTTAVSDDEPGDGATSPKGSRKPAASFNCTGAVRKAGFLSVKKWLLRKRHQVELARRRGWKGYWVCLKGTTLLFYPCDAREARSVEAAPKHLIIVDGAIMQPIPEHPKRDYIFCLSTAFGDAYLFQAPCQVELESWVHSIHWACAAAFARHRGKTGTLHLLQEEIIRLDKAIESDGKLRHMAELQRSVVADPETRQQLAGQIANWEENIERLHCEQFRLRCYMASLQGGELPNPKSLLSHVSRTTKNTLNRLGVFTVSSFHAFVCARSPSLLSNLLAGRGAAKAKRRAPLLSRSNSASSRRSLHASSSDRESEGRTAKISLPENQTVSVSLKDAMTVDEFLTVACGRKNLVPTEHFVRVKKRRELPDTNYFVPFRSDLIETYLSTHEVVEVRAKLLYQVELQRGSLDMMWGFSVEAELWENTDRQDELSCFVSRVEERSVAMTNDCDCKPGESPAPKDNHEEQTPEGIIKSDEILVINGAIVSDLDMMYIESVLQEELSLCLMLRSSRTEPPALAAALAIADAAIAQLVCPPPPLDPDLLTEDALSNLIVPAPHENKDLSPSDTDEIGGHTSGGEGRSSRMGAATDIDTLIKTAGDITTFCRTKERGGRHPQLTHQASIGTDSPPVVMISGGNSPTHSSQLPMGTRDVEKMKKAILELVDTERSYVKHLTGMLEQYLEPLRHENFLSTTEMMAIFGNIREMVAVQRRFLRSLETALESSAAIESINHPSEFKTILHNIASAFLNFADHFKLYSSFCASHSKTQKLLHPVEGNQPLQQFLAARNPKQQHNLSLESYLIKPIQRILKYPLLLQQIRNLCDTNSEEYRTLVESLQCMERVAEHINEMQRIHEEYGAVFKLIDPNYHPNCPFKGKLAIMDDKQGGHANTGKVLDMITILDSDESDGKDVVVVRRRANKRIRRISSDDENTPNPFDRSNPPPKSSITTRARTLDSFITRQGHASASNVKASSVDSSRSDMPRKDQKNVNLPMPSPFDRSNPSPRSSIPATSVSGALDLIINVQRPSCLDRTPVDQQNVSQPVPSLNRSNSQPASSPQPHNRHGKLSSEINEQFAREVLLDWLEELENQESPQYDDEKRIHLEEAAHWRKRRVKTIEILFSSRIPGSSVKGYYVMISNGRQKVPQRLSSYYKGKMRGGYSTAITNRIESYRDTNHPLHETIKRSSENSTNLRPPVDIVYVSTMFPPEEMKSSLMDTVMETVPVQSGNLEDYPGSFSGGHKGYFSMRDNHFTNKKNPSKIYTRTVGSATPMMCVEKKVALMDSEATKEITEGFLMAIFEHLQRQHQKASKTPIDLSPGDLLHYGGVEWSNIAEFLGKIKKGLELHAMCFVFRTAVVFLCKERLRHKKKLISSTSKISDKSEVEIIRYQVLIPVSEVQVRQVGDPKDLDSNGPNYSWELTHLRSSTPRRSEKTYLLSNSTAEFRNVFLRNIRQIMNLSFTSFRAMSLPPRLPDGSPDDGDGAGGTGSGSGGRNGHTSSGGSHYATPEGREYSSDSQQQRGGHGYRPHGHGQAHTLGRKKPPKPPQRHSAGNIEMGPAAMLKKQDSMDSTSGFRVRSKTLSDGKGGTDSEEGGQHREVIGSATMPRAKGVLGTTPNHLTLSTTSTLSAGSTGSAAKLIHASATPGRSLPPPPAPAVPEPSSPIWKPRDGVFDPATLPKKESAEPQPSTSAAASAVVVAAVSSSSSSKPTPAPKPKPKPDTLPKPQR